MDTISADEEDSLYRRHGALIDIKFTRGLTDEEATELETIKDRIHKIQAPYYEYAMRAFYEYFDAKNRNALDAGGA